ncbi:hypothetical protein [Mycoplasma sp. 613B]
MKKRFKSVLLLGLPTLTTVFAVVSCSNPAKTTNETNQSLDYTTYGIAKANQVKERVLEFPAARGENRMDENGVFSFHLHNTPVQGVSGEWTAFATEVKSLTDNTLVKDTKGKPVVKKAMAMAKEVDASKDFPLVFSWTGDNKLTEGKFYTFIFWKNDGTEKITFKNDFIKDNKDIFPATSIKTITNLSIDFTVPEYGVTKLTTGTVKERQLEFPAVRSENVLDANGIFTFKLHNTPVQGVKGEWLAFATEVTSLHDNTLVKDANGKPIVKKAMAMAKANADVVNENALEFSWTGDNKLTEGKFYTFIFFAKDGTERIVFKPEFVVESKDTFEAIKGTSTRKSNSTETMHSMDKSNMMMKDSSDKSTSKQNPNTSNDMMHSDSNSMEKNKTTSDNSMMSGDQHQDSQNSPQPMKNS